jgi:dephospho-CoA kinase
MKKSLQVGITGGIGTGKSTVCKVFSTLGIPVYEADTRAKWLLDNHLSIKEELMEAFGEASYKNGKYNREYLATIVFNDTSQTQRINAIVHPKVFEDYLTWAEKNKQATYLLREAAILFESGSAGLCDKIIVVSSPLDLRISRIRERDTFRSVQEIKAIMDKQMPEAEKIEKADFVIENDEKTLLLPQVLAIHQQLLTLNA